ncbi:unnamed protein product [Oikopleura dioica]|uniref:GDP-fucose protein O-fucosyltransferase 2 n=1 Tax=Oikopleura dioica TaxID=34765 RepID=E4YA58_OIKDI|nr:unnamed protein product [Oikopleura dioica]
MPVRDHDHRNQPPSPVRIIPEDVLEPGQESGCPKWYPDWSALAELQPRIKLDPNKFLTPVLTYGPNNQQRGFRETVFLAVKLNRTIVPPGFFKHSRTDKEEDSESDAHIIAPWHRFDISALATMMSTADPMKIGNECGGHFQSYFKVKPGYCSGSNKDRFNALFDFFSMSFVPGQELTKDKHVCHLENSIPDDKQVLKRFYASEGKCALWVFPYHCIQFKNSLKGNAISEDQLNDSPDLSSESDTDLMQRIIRATPRPKYLRNIAKSFIKNVIKQQMPNGRYLALHWRYNHGDWLQHCEHRESPACDAVLETMEKPKMIAAEIVDFFNARPELEGIYIAAPLEERPLIDAIKSSIGETVPILIGDSLMTHMLGMYPNCKWMKDNFHDIFSSLEQEICSLSDTFLYASGSSWSLNIMMERHARNIRKKKASQIFLQLTIYSERKKLGKHRTSF